MEVGTVGERPDLVCLVGQGHVLERAEWFCGPCWGFGDLTITPFRVYTVTGVLGGGLEAVSTITMHCGVCCVLTCLHLAGRLLWKVC